MSALKVFAFVTRLCSAYMVVWFAVVCWRIWATPLRDTEVFTVSAEARWVSLGLVLVAVLAALRPWALRLLDLERSEQNDDAEFDKKISTRIAPIAAFEFVQGELEDSDA